MSILNATKQCWFGNNTNKNQRKDNIVIASKLH